MPGRPQLFVYPPGADGAGDELQDELLVDEYALARRKGAPRLPFTRVMLELLRLLPEHRVEDT